MFGTYSLGGLHIVGLAHIRLAGASHTSCLSKLDQAVRTRSCFVFGQQVVSVEQAHTLNEKLLLETQQDLA